MNNTLNMSVASQYIDDDTTGFKVLVLLIQCLGPNPRSYFIKTFKPLQMQLSNPKE